MSEKWHLDRASGIIGLGTSSPPTTYCALPEPNTPIPSGPQCVFRNAVGFDSNTWLTSLATATDGDTWSASMWVNFGVNNIPGFVPDPMLGAMIAAIGTPAGSYPHLEVLANTGIQAGVDIEAGGNGAFANYAWPAATDISRGWAHLMVAARILSSVFDSVFYNVVVRYLAVVNDTIVMDTTGTAGLSVAPPQFLFSDATSTSVGTVATSVPAPGGGLYGALAEVWEAPNQFIDWTLRANRLKFHTTNVAGNLYGPVDLGPDGSRPTGVKPRTYLSGPPSLFVKNRADGATLTVNGDALVAVDFSPTF